MVSVLNQENTKNSKIINQEYSMHCDSSVHGRTAIKQHESIAKIPVEGYLPLHKIDDMEKLLVETVSAPHNKRLLACT